MKRLTPTIICLAETGNPQKDIKAQEKEEA